MIDFTNLPRKNKTYAGANGSKLSVIYENEQYMLKFPAFAPKNKDLSYANGCVSEYLGCQIFNCIGVEAQKTLLGTFNKNGKEKIVVACKDFTSPGIVLQDFASLKNTIIDSVHNGYGTELSDILQAIDEQAAVDSVMLKEHFWNMFIIDALIGNWDRHNGNWGFLYNTATDEMTLAPVYDCGSCLYPQADEKMMEAVLEKQEERDFRVYEAPLSNIKLNSRKIKYYDFIYSLQDNDCNKALKRIVSKIDMQKIYAIVDNTPYITDLQKKFYKTMLKERKEKILDKSLVKLKQREKSYER